jgi:hypothetical protein
MYQAFRTHSGRSTQQEYKISLSPPERSFALAPKQVACERTEGDFDDADVYQVPELLAGCRLIHGHLRNWFAKNNLQFRGPFRPKAPLVLDV